MKKLAANQRENARTKKPMTNEHRYAQALILAEAEMQSGDEADIVLCRMARLKTVAHVVSLKTQGDALVQGDIRVLRQALPPDQRG